MKSNPTHWDTIFSNSETTGLGWYEKDSILSLKFLNQIKNWQALTILVTGTGTSALIEDLMVESTKLILNDISAEAINLVKKRIGEKANQITWLCQDIASSLPTTLPLIDIWFDRAVLHFLIEEVDVVGYFNNIKTFIKIGGHVILAEFSTTGALKCAGLTVHRYSLDELSNNMGTDFQLLHHLETTFINPRGEPRPYIYALFKRIK